MALQVTLGYGQLAKLTIMKQIVTHENSEQATEDWRTMLKGKACITLKEASTILSTPENQLRKLIRQGKINPVVAFGRKYRIAVAEIERLLSQRLRNNPVQYANN